MSDRVKRLTAAVGVTAALVSGAALAAPMTGAAETPAEASAGITAYPCGLSGDMDPHPLPGWNYYDYQIRNCHSYAVRRRVNVTNSFSNDGPCLYIPANGIVFATPLLINTQFDYIIGLARC